MLLLLGSVFITPSTAAYRKCGWGGKLSLQNVGGLKVYTMYSLFKSLGGGQELTWGEKSSPREGEGAPPNDVLPRIALLAPIYVY